MIPKGFNPRKTGGGFGSAVSAVTASMTFGDSLDDDFGLEDDLDDYGGGLSQSMDAASGLKKSLGGITSALRAMRPGGFAPNTLSSGLAFEDLNHDFVEAPAWVDLDFVEEEKEVKVHKKKEQMDVFLTKKFLPLEEKKEFVDIPVEPLGRQRPPTPIKLVPHTPHAPTPWNVPLFRSGGWGM